MRNPIQSNPNSTVKNKTGAWRSYRPIFDSEKCTACGACQRVCPEGVILTSAKTNSKGKNYRQADLEFCKGCGICVFECPVKAIQLEQEKN